MKLFDDMRGCIEFGIADTVGRATATTPRAPPRHLRNYETACFPDITHVRSYPDFKVEIKSSSLVF